MKENEEFVKNLCRYCTPDQTTLDRVLYNPKIGIPYDNGMSEKFLDIVAFLGDDGATHDKTRYWIAKDSSNPQDIHYELVVETNAYNYAFGDDTDREMNLNMVNDYGGVESVICDAEKIEKDFPDLAAWLKTCATFAKQTEKKEREDENTIFYQISLKDFPDLATFLKTCETFAEQTEEEK